MRQRNSPGARLQREQNMREVIQIGPAGLRCLLPPGRHRTRRTMRALAPGIAVLLLAGALLASCDGGTGDFVGSAVRANLESATYLTENTSEGDATLEDGEFRAPAASGSAAELVIRLGKWSLGDLDGQGELDAATITVEEPGGSGTFFYLHALINDEGALRDAGFAFLGDRVRIEGVSIHDGVITVAMLDRGLDEPFTAPPSVPVIRQFRLQDGELAEVAGG